MRTYPDCIPCFMNQALNALRFINADDQTIERAFQRILRSAADFELTLSPPEMVSGIHRIIREETAHADPYQAIKKMASDAALEVEDLVRSRIRAAQNPFEAAIRFAIVGNVMDFAVLSWDPKRFQKQLEQAFEKPLNSTLVQHLHTALQQANSVLVLADNAGEALFDKLLLEQIPCPERIYAVKGKPAINDCLLEDARTVGIEKVARIIDNGTDIPGTVLNRCSKSFLHEFNQADVVISKGQGNYESLYDATKREIFYLTQIKCNITARDLHGAVGDWVVTSNSDLLNACKS